MVEDDTGVTPLELAAENSNFQILKLLIKNGNGDPTHMDKNGRSAVHCSKVS